MNPKFSVIIPAHNEEKVIERTIKSILNQTYQNFEIIVSNDGSKDKTKEIVERLIKKDKRIKILNRENGHSAAFARNRGAEKAKGEILIFLDADSYINNIFLEEISKEKRKVDGYIVICLPIRDNFMNKALSGFLAPSKKVKIKEDKIYGKENSHEAGTMFFVITKNAYRKIKGYPEETFYYEDENFSNKFYEKGFKSVLIKKAVQYFELPSTFKEFLRQCKWIGKGINSIKEKKEKNKMKLIWILKTLFLISPLIFLFKPCITLYVFIGTLLISYLNLVLRNKRILTSTITLPFLYLKTFIVTFYVFRFWK